MTDPCELHAQESQRLQPDRLTLTDKERDAMVAVLNRLCGHMTPGERSVLVAMLERTQCA